MDSNTQSSSFLNLLNSQNPVHSDPRSTSTQLGASDFPVNKCDPCSDFSVPNPNEHTVDDRRDRRKWSPTEDVVLISAWLNTSKDLIVANEQRATAFWKCIANYFASSPTMAGMQPREPNHCKQRRSKINEGVCKFVGCYDVATKLKSSGQNENDVVKLAHKIYFNDHKVKFTLEHAWRELCYDQKWCSYSSTKIRHDDQTAQSSTYRADDSVTRPMGSKAAKRAATKPTSDQEGTALQEFQGMWEIKQKDFALKQKLNKQKLLDSLVTKTEPLTEMELALKDKMINDMLASE